MRKLAVALFVVLSAAAGAQALPTTVLGIEIGQPLRAKVCSSSYEGPKKGFCAVNKLAVGKASYSGSTDLLFGAQDAPVWAGTIKAQLIDGKVEMLLITASADAQVLVYRDLQVKFGAPISKNFDANEGGLGSRRLEAGWVNGPVRIDYLGEIAGRDYGYVQVGTPQGIAAWRDSVSKSAPVRRGL